MCHGLNGLSIICNLILGYNLPFVKCPCSENKIYNVSVFLWFVEIDHRPMSDFFSFNLPAVLRKKLSWFKSDFKSLSEAYFTRYYIYFNAKMQPQLIICVSSCYALMSRLMCAG